MDIGDLELVTDNLQIVIDAVIKALYHYVMEKFRRLRMKTNKDRTKA